PAGFLPQDLVSGLRRYRYPARRAAEPSAPHPSGPLDQPARSSAAEEFILALPDAHPDTGQPVGFRVDSRPAALPQAVTLCGRYGSLERLDAARHRANLWEAFAGHGHLWTYMRYGPFADAAVFSDWLSSREQAHDPFYFAIVNPSGQALGFAALMRI